MPPDGLDLARDLAHGLDPVAFAEDRLGFKPDPWQAQVLRSTSPWLLLNCCRQSGKSTTTAVLALHTALYDPGLLLLVSPSLRQSKELLSKVTGFLTGFTTRRSARGGQQEQLYPREQSSDCFITW